MKFAALIVEPDFHRLHIGVRNYIFSFAELLRREYAVHFLTCRTTPGGGLRWTRLHFQNPPDTTGGAIAEDVAFEGDPASVWKAYCDYGTRPESGAPIALTHTDLGSASPLARYDFACVTNPWMVTFRERLAVPLLLGLAYDIVPNEYVFSRGDKPFEFASRHRIGYAYFREHADLTLCISERTRLDLCDRFRFPPAKTAALPPLLPASYADYEYRPAGRAGTVILASPFDLRKGLRRMPFLIGSAGGAIESLLIYGDVRCPIGEVERFFAALPQGLSVRWNLRATAATVRALFERSSLLLFPSLNEGLGLPVLEAQMCGTRVLSTDLPCLRPLKLDGDDFLSGDDAADALLVRRRLADRTFDHRALSEVASSRFSCAGVRPAVERLIGSAVDTGR